MIKRASCHRFYFRSTARLAPRICYSSCSLKLSSLVRGEVNTTHLCFKQSREISCIPVCGCCCGNCIPSCFQYMAKQHRFRQSTHIWKFVHLSFVLHKHCSTTQLHFGRKTALLPIRYCTTSKYSANLIQHSDYEGVSEKSNQKNNLTQLLTGGHCVCCCYFPTLFSESSF